MYLRAILTAFSTATALKPVYITAFCTLIGKDSKTYVPLDTPIVITWGWEAKTEAHIDEFLQNNITTITLDGKVIEGTLNSEVTKNEKSGQPEVAWFSEVGVLDAGQHVITYDVKWKKMIDDGTTTYGPGSKNETLHDECQIIVEAAAIPSQDWRGASGVRANSRRRRRKNRFPPGRCIESVRWPDRASAVQSASRWRSC